MADDEGLSPRGLQCLLIREIGNVRVHFEQMFRDRDKQVDIAFAELQRRLDILNHAHEDMRARDANFYSKEMHDNYATSVQQELNRIHDKILENSKLVLEARKPRYLWVGALAFAGICATGLWELSREISKLDTNQSQVMLSLRQHLDDDATWHRSNDKPKPTR